LLAEFRLWDDLADRETDAASHPNRVLVRAASILPFVAVTIALAVLNLVMAMPSGGIPISLVTLITVHFALGFWYARRRPRTLAGDQLLLAKYPAFVVIVAGSRALDATLVVAVAALLIYTAASIFEAWHDPASPGAALLGGRS
jgi:4-hydroxybenzoate polyprenyltransferase